MSCCGSMTRYYPKKSFRRRFRKKSSPWYQKKYNAMQLATKAWNTAKYIRGMVNCEKHHFDTAFSSASVTNSGAVTILCNLAEGDDYNTRNGFSILAKSLAMRFKLEVNSSVTLDTHVTMLVVMDTQNVASTSPSVTDILSTATPESLLNLKEPGRFTVLHRKAWILTPASGGKPAYVYSKVLNFDHHIKYSGSASTTIQKNGIYVLFISSEATNYPTVNGTFRLGYYDN